MSINSILPADAFQEIFKHVNSVKTLAICERVCKLWQSMILENDSSCPWMRFLLSKDASFVVQGEHPKVSFNRLYGHLNFEEGKPRHECHFRNTDLMRSEPVITSGKILFKTKLPSEINLLYSDNFEFRQSETNVRDTIVVITNKQTNASKTLTQSYPFCGLMHATDNALIFATRTIDPGLPHIVIQDINSGKEYAFGHSGPFYFLNSKSFKVTNNHLYFLDILDNDEVGSLKKIDLLTYTETLPNATASRQFEKILFADDHEIVTLCTTRDATLEPFTSHHAGNFSLRIEIWNIKTGQVKLFISAHNHRTSLKSQEPKGIHCVSDSLKIKFYYNKTTLIVVEEHRNIIAVFETSHSLIPERPISISPAHVYQIPRNEKMGRPIFQKNICLLPIEEKEKIYGYYKINLKEDKLPSFIKINSTSRPRISFLGDYRIFIETSDSNYRYTSSLLDFNPSASPADLQINKAPVEIIKTKTYIAKPSFFQKLYITCLEFLRDLYQSLLDLFN